jgi:hypothetical protein
MIIITDLVKTGILVYHSLKEEKPKNCPRCDAPINRQSWGRKQTSCGKDPCRQYVARHRRDQYWMQATEEAQERVAACAETLQPENRQLLLALASLQIRDYRGKIKPPLAQGPILADIVRRMIDTERCHHNALPQIASYAEQQQRRAEQAEAENCQLRARIQELEESLQGFDALAVDVQVLIDQQQMRQQARRASYDDNAIFIGEGEDPASVDRDVATPRSREEDMPLSDAHGILATSIKRV